LFPSDSAVEPEPGDVSFCEEHWAYLNEKGPIAVFSQTDEPPPPAEELFGEVFRAARVMLDENITDEELIIPTLAFANQASGLPELQAVKDSFAETADDHGRREEFLRDFRQRFKGLEPRCLSDGVLILESKRLSPEVFRYPNTPILKEIEIDVFMRSVKPQEVADCYKLELEQEGVPYDESSEGSFVYRGYPTHLSLVVGPGKNLNADQVARLSSTRRQLIFPPPELVRGFYDDLKGSVYRETVRGFTHVLGGRQSGEAAKADNLIPACVAWYLRKQGGVADDHRLARLLNREILAKHGKQEIGVNSGQAMWKGIDKVGDSIKRVEFILQRGL
jgi:hypothetical protein